MELLQGDVMLAWVVLLVGFCSGDELALCVVCQMVNISYLSSAGN